MPLQNRVDPFGAIQAVAARGLFTGNRGVLHDPATRTLTTRRWTTRAWIICDCDWKNRKRDVFGRNAPSGTAGWTNLFFLDEPTALAAGHRPCFTCRRAQALAYVDAVRRASAQPRLAAADIDRRLHGERLARGAAPPPTLESLPDGTMIAFGAAAFALRGGALLRWSFEGYAQALPDPAASAPRVLTPPTSMAALAHGFAPVWHRTAH